MQIRSVHFVIAMVAGWLAGWLAGYSESRANAEQGQGHVRRFFRRCRRQSGSLHRKSELSLGKTRNAMTMCLCASYWEAYAYAGQNPAMNVDPTGLASTNAKCQSGYSKNYKGECHINDQSMFGGSIWDGTYYGESCKQWGSCAGQFDGPSGDGDGLSWGGAGGHYPDGYPIYA